MTTMLHILLHIEWRLSNVETISVLTLLNTSHTLIKTQTGKPKTLRLE